MATTNLPEEEEAATALCGCCFLLDQTTLLAENEGISLRPLKLSLGVKLGEATGSFSARIELVGAIAAQLSNYQPRAHTKERERESPRAWIRLHLRATRPE
jgi:hypothetical protein